MASRGENLVLVSHRPSSILAKRQRDLFKALKDTFAVDMVHVPVWINKAKGNDREHTQRTRSFLYAALGAVVAESFNAKGVRFFENGVVSLNFPVSDEVLRARASRTTHPNSLKYLEKLFALVVKRDFIVDNPFLLLTKKEVVQVIADNNGSNLIGHTCSCAHQGFFTSKTQLHCGSCSQCIDRRIAILAANLEDYDLEYDYVTDVFTGARKSGYEQNMAVNYVAHVKELNQMGTDEIARRFSRELTLAVREFSNSRQMAQQLVDMHERHAEAAQKVIEQKVASHVSLLVAGKLEPTSMLAMIGGQKHVDTTWKRFANRISNCLKQALPKACQTEKPSNEPRLQEICDAILHSQGEELEREFPFMKWSASATKPDWSAEELALWIELKYVRKKSDVRQITEDIAADITKYGDNRLRILFIVYDPAHIILDECKFSEDIIQHECMVEFIR